MTMPAQSPLWLRELADAVAAHIAPAEFLSPLGCHFCEVDGCWEVSLFASSTEVVGGHRDGRKHQAKFNVNVLKLLSLFDNVHACHWQNRAVSRSDELGAHVSLEGSYQGHPVWLRVLASAPRRFTSGRQARVHENVIVETW